MARVGFGSFSLEVNEGWSLSSVILAGPPDAETPGLGMPTTKAVRPFQRNLVATLERVADSDTAEQYVERQVQGLKAAGVPRREVNAPKNVTLGAEKLAGLITEQEITGPGGERVQQIQLVCIKNGVAHTIIASHLAGAQFEGARAEFEAMLNSFE